jgi:putative heme-binding domain-containing protein
MREIRSLWFQTITLLLALSALLFNPFAGSYRGSQRPQRAGSTKADLDAGKDLFVANCSTCHGADAAGGVGGEGPNIQKVPAALGDDAVSGIIKNGVPGTGMPAFSGLSDAQRLAIVAYVRFLGQPAPSAVAVRGDPAKGKGIYDQNKCSRCHIIDGNGGSLGPELTLIGNLGADVLRQVLLDPGKNLSKSKVSRDRGKWDQFLMFRAVTTDGHAVEGMRVSETTFAIVLEDAKGGYHTFSKSNLRTLERLPGKTFMPSLQGASPAELDDLVAYLSGLKGAQ